jgi:fumarate reductase (CoM/CoB) subunit A
LTLKHALENIDSIEKEFSIRKFGFSRKRFELENAICVSRLIIESALKRKESIGAHYRTDSIEDKLYAEKGIRHDEILVK